MSVELQIQSYIRSLQERHLRKPRLCKVCLEQKPLRWHGFYERTLITLTKTFTLAVRRILCVRCGQTFGLLPNFIVKFHRYAKEVIRFALQQLKSQTYESVLNLLMERGGHQLASLTLYFWRRKFV